jgi:uncharacterized membrane protein
MAHELISPNLHVALIHGPLGLLIAGTLIELFSFLWSRSDFRTAGRWMILLGALSAVPATFSGIYALNSIAQTNNPVGEGGAWTDVKAASPLLSDPVIWQMMRRHLLYQSIATGLAVLAVVVWLGGSDRARASLHWPLLGTLVLAVVLIVAGSYFGGESIYRHGVGVDTERASPGAKAETSTGQDQPRHRWEQLLPPVELHVIGAGTAVAIALAAIGLSFRKITATYELEDTRPIRPRDETMAPSKPGPRTPPSPVSMLRSFNPEIEVTVAPFAPAARFWLLTCLLGVITIAGGLYVSHSDEIQAKQNVFKAVWEEINPAHNEGGQKINRLFGHVTAGAVILLTPLVLAGLARFAPRHRIGLGIFTLILLVAVAAQIWFGVLLLFDTPVGSISKFRTAEGSAPVPAATQPATAPATSEAG